MLKLCRESISCDLKRFAREKNEILFVEVFGRNQIIKAITASIIEKRSDFLIKGNRLSSIAIDKGAKYKRKIVPLSDGYAHGIVYKDELFSELYCIAKDKENRLEAFQRWVAETSLPIPNKTNPVFIDMLYNRISYALDWIHMEVKNEVESFKLTKKESLSFCNMKFYINNEYEKLAEAVEDVFADFKMLKKVA